ncbi:hypothetical protein [Devosia nitrariae]|uniref:Uncharacterized protein n=1 Tax=Devosia nitrariae TaxID=2071872 RepID=A0ABQ5W112_9HYPH|nr:hypothetical protein [Devosia nitrariae]GLQ53408.1 hypothetical protein GCM10010862_06660 [Devosia nitrariae]
MSTVAAAQPGDTADRVMPRPHLNSLFLPQDSSLRRGFISPNVPREAQFLAHFEDRCIFYDVFWDEAGKRILLHGPPPVNLAQHYRNARYTARPSGTRLRARGHHSQKVHIYSLAAPAGTTHLEVEFAGMTFTVPVGANYSSWFEGQNLLATVSKNNDLQWIADWARFHVVNQGASAVLLFDNASDRYAPADIEATLVAVNGLDKICVVPAPFAYQRPDNALPDNRFWAHFLQPSLFTNMFRRYAARASGILDCDIDELAVPLTDETVFETARASRSGTVYFRNRWIEPVPVKPRPDGVYRHRDFCLAKADDDVTRGGTTKWAMAPDRRWMQDLRVQPRAHLIINRPPLTRHKPGTAYIAHFRGISTSWKYDRRVTLESDDTLVEDTRLSALLKSTFPEAGSAS